MQMPRFLQVCMASACLLVSAAAAHGQYASIARGLYLMGFTPDVTTNRLTKGIDFTYSRSFNDFSSLGNTISYGGSSLTLNGGLLFQGSVAKRPFPGASFGIKTAANPDSAAGDLRYTLTIPRAAEQITVTGTISIETKTTVDATGFYSTVTNIENRATVTGDGLTDFERNIDFNVGPVNQVGNIYLDGLGNIVNLFGGPGDEIAGLPDTGPLFATSLADAASLDSLDLDDPEQLEQYVNAVLLQGITQAAMDPTTAAERTPFQTPIPEPSTVALLALSSMGLLAARRRLIR